jgi:hypothetical protein
MADLNSNFPNPTWRAVPQIEPGDRVLGGPGGVINLSAQALLERTEFLRARRGAPGGTCDLDALGKVPLGRLNPMGRVVTVNFAGAQTLSPSVFTTLTLTPSVTTDELFTWSAGVFTVQRAGLYRFTSRIHFAVQQSSGTCSALLRHVYALGSSNTTTFSPAPTTFRNHVPAASYTPPGGSGSAPSLFDLSADGSTFMNVGDRFNIEVFTDSNAPSVRAIDNSSAARQTLIVHFVG